MNKTEIEVKDLFEIMDVRTTGYGKTINNVLYLFISMKELADILRDCGVKIKIGIGHNKPLDSDHKSGV